MRPIGKKAKYLSSEKNIYSDFKHDEVITFLGVSTTFVKLKNNEDYHFYEFINEDRVIEELELGEFEWIEDSDTVIHY